MKGFLRDNGLSLVLIALFVLFLAGQTVFGWLNYKTRKMNTISLKLAFGSILELELGSTCVPTREKQWLGSVV